MTKAGLKFISDTLVSAQIPYEFMEYTSAIDSISSYWVGEYSEIEPIAEDGQEETQFILTGTGKEWLELENQKDKIKKLFPERWGKRAILDDGSGIAVFYGNAFPVATGDGFLKRLQINLIVKEWRTE